MKNKSQVSVFVLLGIIFVIVFIVFLLASSDSGAMRWFLKDTSQPVPYYVKECMKFNVVDSIEILAAQGGFIYTYNPNLTTTKRTFAYSIYSNQNTSPSISFMESEIERYIEENIDSCLDDSTIHIMKTGSPEAKVTIFPESVDAELIYALETVADDVTYRYNSYQTRHFIPYGRMVELRNIVVNDLLDYPNLMLLDKLYDTDFEMIINPYSGNIKVIDMINTSARLRTNPLKFSFAIYDDHYLPSILDFEGNLPNITVFVGTPYLMQINASHHCKFYDNTVLFDIDEDTGLINYVPDALDIGQYNITITLDDDTYKVSKKFKLTVSP